MLPTAKRTASLSLSVSVLVALPCRGPRSVSYPLLHNKPSQHLDVLDTLTIYYLYPFSVGWEFGDDPADGVLLQGVSSQGVAVKMSAGADICHLKAFPGPAGSSHQMFFTHMAAQLLLVVGGRPWFLSVRIPGCLTSSQHDLWLLSEWVNELLFVTTTRNPYSVISAVTAGCTYCGREHTAGSGCQIARLGLGGGVGSHLGGWLSPEICEQKNVQKHMHVFMWRKKPPPNARTHKCV